MATALYPGTFDPVTNGHLDILQRASRVFERVVVSASEASHKTCAFSLEERLSLLRTVAGQLPNVEVMPFKGLVVECARQVGAGIIVRGLRQTTDFDYEFAMATMNTRLAPDIETLFLVASSQYHYLSSSLVREIAALGGDISQFVPPEVEDAIISKLK